VDIVKFKAQFHAAEMAYLNGYQIIKQGIGRYAISEINVVLPPLAYEINTGDQSHIKTGAKYTSCNKYCRN
jgi:hypothetical protein